MDAIKKVSPKISEYGIFNEGMPLLVHDKGLFLKRANNRRQGGGDLIVGEIWREKQTDLMDKEYDAKTMQNLRVNNLN